MLEEDLSDGLFKDIGESVVGRRVGGRVGVSATPVERSMTCCDDSRREEHDQQRQGVQ